MAGSRQARLVHVHKRRGTGGCFPGASIDCRSERGLLREIALTSIVHIHEEKLNVEMHKVHKAVVWRDGEADVIVKNLRHSSADSASSYLPREPQDRSLNAHRN